MTDQRPLTEISRQITDISHFLWERQWVANHEGNITVRLPGKKILATPTAMSKGDITTNDLIVTDMFGRVVRGNRRPFGEMSMHLAVYGARPDCGAVIHAHPPYSTAFAMASREISGEFSSEFRVSTGPKVPLVPFALAGTDAMNNALIPFLRDFDCVLLENHGILAWGDDLTQARLRIEHCESYAKILALASTLGPIKSLPETAKRILDDKRRRAGFGPDGRNPE